VRRTPVQIRRTLVRPGGDRCPGEGNGLAVDRQRNSGV